MSIMKCDECQDGYLIVKKNASEGRFLGCTNYNKSGNGCSGSLSQKQYYKLMKYDWQEEMVLDREDEKETIAKSLKQESRNYPEISKREIKVKESKYDLEGMNAKLYMILSCLNHVSEKNYYGVQVLIGVLKGTKNEKIMKAGLDGVPEYGELADMPWEQLKYIIEWLIQKNYILQTKGKYPVLHPTYNGMHYTETMTDSLIRQLIKELTR